ncbi:MAG: helical backbone metal receptor, partial [Bacteroidota bacterium]
QIVDRVAVAKRLQEQIQQAFYQLAQHLAQQNDRPKVAYLIWRKPYMVAAQGTFIDEMLQLGGFRNAFAQQNRYPAVNQEALQAAAPAFVFLSSEPYPFKEQHQADLQTICPTARIELVDGELFSWYGSRLLHSAPYLLNLRNKLDLR